MLISSLHYLPVHQINLLDKLIMHLVLLEICLAKNLNSHLNKVILQLKAFYVYIRN